MVKVGLPQSKCLNRFNFDNFVFVGQQKHDFFKVVFFIDFYLFLWEEDFEAVQNSQDYAPLFLLNFAQEVDA